MSMFLSFVLTKLNENIIVCGCVCVSQGEYLMAFTYFWKKKWIIGFAPKRLFWKCNFQNQLTQIASGAAGFSSRLIWKSFKWYWDNRKRESYIVSAIIRNTYYMYVLGVIFQKTLPVINNHHHNHHCTKLDKLQPTNCFGKTTAKLQTFTLNSIKIKDQIIDKLSITVILIVFST